MTNQNMKSLVMLRGHWFRKTKAFALVATPNAEGKPVIGKTVFAEILNAMCLFPKLSKRLKKDNASVL